MSWYRLIQFVFLGKQIWIVLFQDADFVFVLPFDVPDPVGLSLTFLGAKGALELGFLAAFVRQMSLQRVLPNVAPTALIADEVAPDPAAFLFRLGELFGQGDPGVQNFVLLFHQFDFHRHCCKTDSVRIGMRWVWD